MSRPELKLLNSLITDIAAIVVLHPYTLRRLLGAIEVLQLVGLQHPGIGSGWGAPIDRLHRIPSGNVARSRSDQMVHLCGRHLGDIVVCVCVRLVSQLGCFRYRVVSISGLFLMNSYDHWRARFVSVASLGSGSSIYSDALSALLYWHMYGHYLASSWGLSGVCCSKGFPIDWLTTRPLFAGHATRMQGEMRRTFSQSLLFNVSDCFVYFQLAVV